MFNITTAQGKDFVNRGKELTEILGELANPRSRIGFAIYGSRRLGKTSLFREVGRRLSTHPSLCPIYFSLWDLAIKELEYFVKRFTEKILEPYRKHFRIKYTVKDLFSGSYQLVKNILKSVKISVPIGESIEFLLFFDREKIIDPDKLLDEVFRLPDKLAVESGKKSILLMDEFPDITSLKFSGRKIGADVIGKLRTVNEEYQKTSLNIAGSIRSTMKAVALSPQSAFYRQFIVREILPFDEESAHDLLQNNITASAISRELGNEVHSITGGVPLYIQYLGRILAGLSKKELEPLDAQFARDMFLDQDAQVLFKQDIEALSEKERYIIVEIAHCQGEVPHAHIDRALKGKFTNLSLYIKRLVDKNVLSEIGKGCHDFTDPLFKEWVRRNF